MVDFDLSGLQADLDEMIGGLVQSVIFKARGKAAQTVACAIGEVSNSTTGSEEGLFGEDSIGVTVKASLLSWTPRDGDVATIEGADYRIRAAKRVPGDAAYSFELEAIAKK